MDNIHNDWFMINCWALNTSLAEIATTNIDVYKSLFDLAAACEFGRRISSFTWWGTKKARCSTNEWLSWDPDVVLTAGPALLAPPPDKHGPGRFWRLGDRVMRKNHALVPPWEMENALGQTLGVIWFYSPHPDPRHHLRNVGHWSLEGQKKGCECVHLHSLPSLEKKTENISSTQECSVPCSICRMALFPAD